MNNHQLAAGTAYHLNDLRPYSEQVIAKRVIARKNGGDIILLALQQGQSLKEHTAPMDAIVQILEGKCQITIAGEEHRPEAGQIIILPANIPHTVSATEGNFKMLLTKIKD